MHNGKSCRNNASLARFIYTLMKNIIAWSQKVLNVLLTQINMLCNKISVPFFFAYFFSQNSRGNPTVFFCILSYH
jgi:hypothetical protein